MEIRIFINGNIVYEKQSNEELKDFVVWTGKKRFAWSDD